MATVRRYALAVCSLVVSASCSHPQKPPCDEAKVTAQIKALGQLHTAAALGVIASGKCDAYKGRPVTECPAYQVIHAAFLLNATAAKEACK